MPKNKETFSLHRRDIPATFPQSILRRGTVAVVVCFLLMALFQSACLFKRDKKAVMPSAPIRIAYLPFNIPEGNEEIQWTAMAIPALMAKITQESPALNIVPLWETMPLALESVGNLREITSEDASYVANWLNAEWALMGDLSEDDNKKVSLLLDFIPARDTNVPFRYIKVLDMDAFDISIREAFNQFLYYISVVPIEDTGRKQTRLASLRMVAEALDREYGWSVPAEPGLAEDIVTNLAQSDIWLTRYLFNPDVYTILKDK